MISEATLGQAGPRATMAARLESYRNQILPLILDAIPSGEPRKHLYGLVEEQLRREGKGIRPALCLATCAALGGDVRRALPAAAALEMMHNAFLVHDDVEDDSDYRRGKPTLNRAYGVPIAVNVGDAMNALSARLMKQSLPLLGPELAGRIFDEFDHLSIETIEGQAMELGWIRDNDCSTTEADYLLLVLKKTSWYSFIHPMRIGAIIAQPGRTDLSAFNRLGYFLGAAFQIQDDVLNLTGNRGTYGKEIGGDLLEGKRTLILAHLLQQVNGSEKQRLVAFLAKPRAERLPREVAWVFDLLHRYKSIDYARQASLGFASAARQELDAAYGDAKPGADVDFIRALLDYLVHRDV